MTSPDQAQSPSGGASPATARNDHRHLLETTSTIVFSLLVLGFGGAYIASRRDGVVEALGVADPSWLAVAVLAGIAAQLAAMLAFRVLFQAAAPGRLPTVAVANVFFVSQLGKYVPGSVWPIVAVTSMSNRYGIARRDGATAGMLSLVISLAVGAVVGAVLTAASAASDSLALRWLLLVPLASLVLVRPGMLVAGVNLVLRLLRRDEISLVLTNHVVRPAVGWSLAAWLLLGLQCWALVVALGGSTWASLVPAVGGFALAYVTGTAFVPSPGGIGIREAVLAVALAGTIVGEAGFTHERVLVVVLLSRVLLAVLDFSMATGAMLLARRARGAERGRRS